jgi:hypothetical protein
LTREFGHPFEKWVKSVIKLFRRTIDMKHKETSDDAAIKQESALQRARKKDGFPESEYPERYKRDKGNKNAAHVQDTKRKKELREDRDRTEKMIEATVNQEIEREERKD